MKMEVFSTNCDNLERYFSASFVNLICRGIITMAPKEEDTTKAVNDYLVTTNRPYSVNDIFLNLHKEHGKAALQRCLDKLVAEEKLKVKVNGKQSCYFANQDLLETCSDQELESLDKKCSEVDQELRNVGENARQMEARLKTLRGSLTSQEAEVELGRLQETNTALRERLLKLESNQTVISAEDRAKVVQLHSSAVTQWKKRKRMVSDVLDSVLEGWPKSKQSLLEEIGVDTDESVGVSIPKR